MIGDTPVDLITRADVLAIVSPIWTVKPETGRRLLEIIRTVLARAQDYEYIPANPAAKFSPATLPPQPKFRNHHKALVASAVADAIRTVDESTAFETTKAAFRYLVLTASRTGETLGATWPEVNVEARTWTIPGDRTKTGKEHRVALSHGALAVLQQAATLRKDNNPLVFPNERSPGKPLSDMCFSVLLKRLGIAAVPHGFRASFRTWAQEETEADYSIMGNEHRPRSRLCRGPVIRPKRPIRASSAFDGTME